MLGAIAGHIIGSLYFLSGDSSSGNHCLSGFHLVRRCNRNAISLGGDSDTLACIAGGIAEAYYGGIPMEIRIRIMDILPPDLLEIADAFTNKFK